jgi:hypothetical protein
MNPGSVHRGESTEARVIFSALSETGQCVSCLAESTGLAELAIRGVMATVLKSRVVDAVGPCGTCNARRLVCRLAGGRTTY